mmetsp:Transcript_21101/g.42462  ORF Transcript_21101/g.42462 Transcript_21101/m.42462 type:complete len:85 (+) Transcript_21101:136-390(+)
MEVVTVSHMSDSDILKILSLHEEIDELPRTDQRRTLQRLLRKLGIRHRSCLGRTILKSFTQKTRERAGFKLSQFIACVSFALKT